VPGSLAPIARMSIHSATLEQRAHCVSATVSGGRGLSRLDDNAAAGAVGCYFHFRWQSGHQNGSLSLPVQVRTWLSRALRRHHCVRTSSSKRPEWVPKCSGIRAQSAAGMRCNGRPEYAPNRGRSEVRGRDTAPCEGAPRTLSFPRLRVRAGRLAVVRHYIPEIDAEWYAAFHGSALGTHIA
jgi:hypothetical protein